MRVGGAYIDVTSEEDSRRERARAVLNASPSFRPTKSLDLGLVPGDDGAAAAPGARARARIPAVFLLSARAGHALRQPGEDVFSPAIEEDPQRGR